MSSLSERILAAQDLRHEDVEVPEWGITIRLRQMGADELVAFQDVVRADPSPQNSRAAYLDRCALVLFYCARDPETGEAIFTAKELAELKRKNIDVISRLADKALELNKRKPVEEAAGE